ncbi:cyclic nucleotide-binding domain-containing protein 2-like [Amphiura filiformis]|uniref:cyclic nucleotide-binding domain-containing protein 2-like n=1 Tax=Amphiura filiformis TaxID=82378 RepID=UPI003B2133CC
MTSPHRSARNVSPDQYPSCTFQPGFGRIARKAPFDRTPDEIIRMYTVMKNMKAFERFSHRMRMEISKTARYSCCEKGRVILRQGHVGHNFYFIYSGSVFVQVDVEDDNTGVLTAGTTLVMEKGACFGELALLVPGGKRTASIICRETTELFEIEKETFLEVCPDIFERELSEKMDAVLQHEFFQQWPKDRLERLCFESRIEEVMHGRVIDPDTANTDTLYFVLRGKITILKAFSPRQKLANLNIKKRDKLPHTTPDDRCFMKIAELKEGEKTELTALRTGDVSTDPGVMLVSNGVRLMRMSKQKLERFAPRGLVERLRRQYKPILVVPKEDDLLLRYQSDVDWQKFKSNICASLNKELRRLAITDQ